MNKIKEKIYNLFIIIKKSIEKFPITIISILVLTVIYAINLDNDFFTYKVLTNITLSLSIFASSTFLIETLLQNKTKSKIIYYIVSFFWSLILTFLTNIEETVIGISNEVFLLKLSRVIVCYVITLIVLSIYYNYKKSTKTFEEYVTKVLVSLFKISLIYSIFAIGIAIITAIFIYLILNGKGYILIARMEILLIGVYYLPTIIYAFYQQEEEIGKFAKIVIKYVLETLVISAFVIIYMYIVKIIILRDMPSNQIFRILSALFLTGIPIWTMCLSIQEGKLLDKINTKLPVLFIPFIFLQIYSIGVRIKANGITPLRYMCIMLIIFEIIYTIIYLKNKEKVGKILLVFIALTIISGLIPYVNMFNISILSQYNNLKIYKQKTTYTDEEKSKIYGAYYYLKYSPEGEKYIQNNYSEKEIDEIQEFSYKNYYESGTINIYSSNKLEYIEIEGYKRLYNINAYCYINSQQEKSLDETFNDVSFNIQGANRSVNVNVIDLIKEYIKHKTNIDEYFEKENEINVDDNKKIILNSISIEYDKITDNIKYYNLSGYLLEK